MLPLVSLGSICSTCVHSQSHLHFAQFIPNQSSRLTTFPSILNCWSNEPPKMPPWGIVGRIVLGYVHSQMNPHMCTKFGANRSSRLTASQNFWICDPLTPPPCPLWYWGATCIYMPIPRWIRRREPKLVPIGLAVWQLPLTLECLTP